MMHEWKIGDRMQVSDRLHPRYEQTGEVVRLGDTGGLWVLHDDGEELYYSWGYERPRIRPIFYVEVDGKPQPATQEEANALLGDINRRRVARTWVGLTEVSTIFIPYDGQVEGPPLIYETMTFSPVEELDEWQEQYPTREAALAGHERIVAEVRARREEQR